MPITAAPYFLRPKTILQEFDLTQMAGTPTGTSAFLNGEFRRGSLTPKYVGGTTERFYQNYGDYSDPSLSYAHDTGVAFLASRGQLLVNRVAPSDATHAAIHVLVDDDVGIKQTLRITFAGVLVTGNVVALEINSVAVATTVFDTSNNQTMANLATALANHVDIDTATVIVGSGNNLSIDIVANVAGASALTLTDSDITLGASQTTVSATTTVAGAGTGYGRRMLFHPSQYGYAAGYENGFAGVTMLKFLGPLITANVFEMDISDGSTVENVSVVFQNNHYDTMLVIAQTISATLANFGDGGYAYVYVETSSSSAQPYTILIVPPTNATITFSGETVTLGATQAAVRLTDPENGWFMTVFAENPGVWANDIGIRINNVDQGVRERRRLTFSNSFVTGNTFTITVNDYTITPVLFAVNSDTYLQNIATEIAKIPHIRSATVEQVIGASDNDRSIIIVAEVPGPDALTITNAAVTGGASQPIMTHVRTLSGKLANGSFALEVYSRSSPNVPIERHVMTTFPYRNGRGEQIQYTTLVNTGASASLNMRLVVNPILHTSGWYEEIMGDTMLAENFQFRTTTSYLGGGFDGSNVLTSQLISALDRFEDRVHYPFNLVLNAGYTDVEYQQAITLLSERRNDCTTILDMPTSKQGSAESGRDYRLYDLNIDSSHAAMYSPDILVSDVTTGEHRYIPPSGMVAAAYVYSDTVGARWSAPAGFNRGKLRQALGFRIDYSPSDEELLHPVGVNCLVDRPGIGPVIMGEQTLQYETSALSSVHVRRLMNLIETTLVDGLDYTLFEPHTESTRFQVTQLAESVLSPIHRREGLYGYFVQCDGDNNTADIIDADALALDVYVKPVRAIKGILLRAIIVRTGVSFEIISAQFNGNTTTIS